MSRAARALATPYAGGITRVAPRAYNAARAAAAGLAAMAGGLNMSRRRVGARSPYSQSFARREGRGIGGRRRYVKRRRPSRRVRRAKRRFTKKVKKVIMNTAEHKFVPLATVNNTTQAYRGLMIVANGRDNQYPVPGTGPEEFIGDEYYMRGHLYKFKWEPVQSGANPAPGTGELQTWGITPNTRVVFAVYEVAIDDRPNNNNTGQTGLIMCGSDTAKNSLATVNTAPTGWYTRVANGESDATAATNKYDIFEHGVLRPGVKCIHKRIIKPSQIEQPLGKDSGAAPDSTTEFDTILHYSNGYYWSYYDKEPLHVKTVTGTTAVVPPAVKKVRVMTVYTDNQMVAVGQVTGTLFWYQEHHFRDP